MTMHFYRLIENGAYLEPIDAKEDAPYDIACNELHYQISYSY